MSHFVKRGPARCTYPCGRRIGGHQVRALGLQRSELDQQGVEVGVGDLGSVGLVVPLVMVDDEGPKFIDPLAVPVHETILPRARDRLRSGP